MYKINTRLLSLEQLVNKEYSHLLFAADEFNEVISDFEFNLIELELIEEEVGFLDEEQLSECNFMVTQLDFIYKNLNKVLEVMREKEDKCFVINDEVKLYCLN
jgi:hypothetical protein